MTTIAQPTTPQDTIEAAVRHGAAFDQLQDGTWRATARRRGRTQPLATFVDADKAEAAAMFLRYFTHPRKA